MTTILNAYSKSVRQPHPKCGKTMTEQHHKKACDINTIMDKYQKTGLVDHVNKHAGSYGDVSGADFKSAQDLIAEQKTIFYELPSSVRDQLDNDPGNYLDLVMTDEGIEELSNMLNPVEEPTEEPKKEAPEGPQTTPETENTVVETS